MARKKIRNSKALIVDIESQMAEIERERSALESLRKQLIEREQSIEAEIKRRVEEALQEQKKHLDHYYYEYYVRPKREGGGT